MKRKRVDIERNKRLYEYEEMRPLIVWHASVMRRLPKNIIKSGGNNVELNYYLCR